MVKRYDHDAGGVSYDKLVLASPPTPDIFSVDVTGTGTLKRGTVLALSAGTAGDGTYKILGTTPASNETLTANAVLADDADMDDGVTVTAYRAGHFNRGALIVKAGYTFTAEDEEALRGVGILLSDAIEL